VIFERNQASFVMEKERMVDALKERLNQGSEPMKQEPLAIQIGRRIVLREARRMRDPMRRRTGHGSWPMFDKYPLAIFCSLPIVDYSFIQEF